MPVRTLLFLTALSLAGTSLLFAQSTKTKKSPKKASAVDNSKPLPAATPTATPLSEPYPEPTREGVTTEAKVLSLDGTIMVHHGDKGESTALQTGSTVEKGDEIRVYEKAWVILRTRWGDRIGFPAGTEVSVDEIYFEGPDRQIRLVLRKGSVYLRTGNADSRQSFFEVQAGSQVASIGDCEARLDFDPDTQRLKVQYLNGKVRVIDQEKETKFSTQNSEQIWEAGKKTSGEDVILEETAVVNFRRFFDGLPDLEIPDANRLIPPDSREKLPSKR